MKGRAGVPLSRVAGEGRGLSGRRPSASASTREARVSARAAPIWPREARVSARTAPAPCRPSESSIQAAHVKTPSPALPRCAGEGDPRPPLHRLRLSHLFREGPLDGSFFECGRTEIISKVAGGVGGPPRLRQALAIHLPLLVPLGRRAARLSHDADRGRVKTRRRKPISAASSIPTAAARPGAEQTAFLRKGWPPSLSFTPGTEASGCS